MQILGSLCLDEKAMWFTNVTPTPTPRTSMRGGQGSTSLLRRRNGSARRLLHQQVKAKMRKREKEGKTVSPVDYSQFMMGLDPSAVDRSVLKRAVMCTSYGASCNPRTNTSPKRSRLLSKRTPMTPIGHKRLVTMQPANCLPKCDELNEWFKAVGKAAMIRVWSIPLGHS